MPRPTTRQPRPINRTVLSVSIPIKPDWVDANRAAGMLNETLSSFVREAIRQRAARVLSADNAHDRPAAAA